MIVMMMMMMVYLGDERGGDEVRVWKHGAVSGHGHVQLSGVRHERHADGGGVERREPEHDVTNLSATHADGTVGPRQVTDQQRRPGVEQSPHASTETLG